MTNRLLSFEAELKEARIDAAFVLKPYNVFYFAGYSSVCSGVLVFPDSEPLFCTLWLDAPEARQLCALPNVASYAFPGDSLIGRMIKLLRKRNSSPKRLGIERDFMLVRDYQALETAFPGAEFAHVTPMVDRLRAVKTDEEIGKMRKAAMLADQAMNAALKAVQPGVTEIDVAAEAEYAMRRSGAEKTAFGTFVASGPRTLLAHPHATRRVIMPGDPVVIDLGPTWDGYASDICRTTFAGDPTSDQIRRLEIVVHAQRAATETLKDGALAGDVFHAAYQVFKTHGLATWLPHDIGYGVGLRQSEFYPVIEKDSRAPLRQNMAVALLHTTAYEKTVGGLRVEDTFVVTKDGYERLTAHVQPFV